MIIWVVGGIAAFTFLGILAKVYTEETANKPKRGRDEKRALTANDEIRALFKKTNATRVEFAPGPVNELTLMLLERLLTKDGYKVSNDSFDWGDLDRRFRSRVLSITSRDYKEPETKLVNMKTWDGVTYQTHVEVEPDVNKKTTVNKKAKKR